METRFATSKKLRANENLLKNAGEPSKQRPWGSLRDTHQVVLWCSKRPSSFHNLGVNAWTSPTFNSSYKGCQNEQINYIFPYKTRVSGGYKTRIILGGSCGQPDELLEKNNFYRTNLDWDDLARANSQKNDANVKSQLNFHSYLIHAFVGIFSKFVQSPRSKSTPFAFFHLKAQSSAAPLLWHSSIIAQASAWRSKWKFAPRLLDNTQPE